MTSRLVKKTSTRRVLWLILGISKTSRILLQLPKLARRVRLPYPALSLENTGFQRFSDFLSNLFFLQWVQNGYKSDNRHRKNPPFLGDFPLE